MGHAGGVALVAGVTGIVGLSLAELLVETGAAKEAGDDGQPSWRVYGVARRPKPTWFKHHLAAYLQCDLLDKEQTLATLSPLTDVTHLFFTTWTDRDTEEESVKANASMLRNTMDALLGLRHVSLLTGSKEYLGSTDGMLAAARCRRHPVLRIFSEDESGPDFYHAQEDILCAAAAASSQLTWSVHRAAGITGVSPIGVFNFPLFLAAYALMCKQEGLPFRYPGDSTSWESHMEFSDSHLIAEHQIWTATHPAAHNQAFNITNGDAVPWKTLWPAVASFFGLEVPPYTGEPLRLVDAMQGKAHVWDSIVHQYKLHPTISWEHLSRIGWFTLDMCFLTIPPYRLNMEKSTQLGFQGSRDSTTCLLNTFQEMNEMGIIPSSLHCTSEALPT